MNILWSSAVLKWIARVLSALYAVMWAVAWWNETQARQGDANTDWFWQWAIFTHVVPFLLALAGIVAGWKRPIYGVIAFGVIAVVQVLSVGTEWAYLGLVALPPIVVAVVYLVGWIISRRQKSNRS